MNKQQEFVDWLCGVKGARFPFFKTQYQFDSSGSDGNENVTLMVEARDTEDAAEKMAPELKGWGWSKEQIKSRIYQI